ncbi:Tat (twin-arginine translocation) pathway signal sequence [Modicisalibacter muralis]|uniref:Tat (Twin-arginine translocation) pathway signal sequence n=1 Tax=Modicisalibacter muralis TaxID=119000 RepID=A0A1G9IWH7_9GAMM|nr:high-potential iron-sulfur protein [Halomonas muralis]SDL29436.1 Tat (twin-arginine translocation) pathway signal sequence [Halomonas muralis]
MANHSRRDFMRHSLFGLAALPLGAGMLSSRALAQELTPLDPENPQAKALNYVTDASQASGHAAYEEGETCANCMFFQQANNGCQLFPQNSVAPEGWCQSWTAKPA